MGLNKQVTFSTAKLLKEKGYSWECENFYKKGKYDKKFYLTTGSEYDSDRNCIWDWNLNGGRSGTLSKVIPYPNESTAIYYSAPTISEVVMWLYEKYGMWIYSFRHDFDKEFYWSIDTKNEDEFTSDDVFNSPTKAYEAAIEYTLNNLI